VSKTVIDGDGIDRVFDIFGASSQVIISDLAIVNGSPPYSEEEERGGGGIRNRGMLTLGNVSVSGNSAAATAGSGAGGGVLNEAACVMTNTTVEGNSAGAGGGIYNSADGVLRIAASTLAANSAESGGGMTNEGTGRIVNTTFSGNSAGSGQAPQGGGISNGGVLEILQSTIAANSSLGEAGGIAGQGDTTVTNTIIADNTPGNCRVSGGLLSLGNNLESANSCGLSMPTDLVHTNPLLGPLRDNEGPTKTMAFIQWSPAIDAGQDLSDQGVTVDQRGLARPSGGGFDIGAYEWQRVAVTPFIVPLLLGEQAYPDGPTQ
jgi:hypothetical protein